MQKNILKLRETAVCSFNLGYYCVSSFPVLFLPLSWSKRIVLSPETFPLLLQNCKLQSGPSNAAITAPRLFSTRKLKSRSKKIHCSLDKSLRLGLSAERFCLLQISARINCAVVVLFVAAGLLLVIPSTENWKHIRILLRWWKCWSQILKSSCSFYSQHDF